MKKLHFIPVLIIIFSLCAISYVSAKSSSEAPTASEIKWTTIDKSIANAAANNKKFILVDLYTDWCGWCKKMDEGTYTDPNIQSSMNANFVAVKFNAETKDVVSFKNESYSFIKTGARGANKLAIDLGSVGGRLGYPTIVVLDANGNKLQSFAGYKDVETLAVILKYFQSGTYKTMDFQQFQSGQ